MRRGSHVLILIGLVVGAGVGLVTNRFAARPVVAGTTDPLDTDRNGVDDRVDWVARNLTDPIGKVFLRLIFMVVLPLVFSALVLGTHGMGDLRHLGRVGLRTLAFTVFFSVAAVAIGLTLVNTIRPGSGLSSQQREALKAQYTTGAVNAVQRARQAKSIRDTLLDIIPENPLQEMVGALDGSSKGNGMLAVMFFSLLLGAALTRVPAARSAALVAWLEALFDASMVVIGFAMRLAPLAVACLVFGVCSRLGMDILRTLAWFVLTVVTGLALHYAVVYSLALRFFSRLRPGEFFREISEVTLTALGTSSSNATLPTAIRTANERLHLPRDIVQFVLTVGATGNQNGTALYEGVVVLFLAQVFGVHLSIAQQVTVLIMSVLAGIGTAGVPGGSLPLIVVVLQSVGVPGEGIGIILGVDRLLDMLRTVVNVTGDLAIAACVSRYEKGGPSPQRSAL